MALSFNKQGSKTYEYNAVQVEGFLSFSELLYPMISNPKIYIVCHKAPIFKGSLAILGL